VYVCEQQLDIRSVMFKHILFAKMDQTQVNQTYEVFSKLQFVSGTCADAEHTKLTRQNNNNKKTTKNQKCMFWET
jgi:hypothetical protein